MPTLLDPPTDDEILLLKVVARAYDDADFKWPIWQYVVRRAVEQGLDALDVLKGMPHWGNGYRFVRTDFRAGAGPEEGATVQLTAAGLWHSGEPLMLELFRVLIVALGHAAWRQAGMRPNPLEVVHESMSATEFMPLLDSHRRSGGRRQPLFDELTLYQMFSAEPVTWNCVAGNGGPEWVFHLNPVQLNKYLDIDKGGGAIYLTALEELIGTPPLPELLTPLHPPRCPRFVRCPEPCLAADDGVAIAEHQEYGGTRRPDPGHQQPRWVRAGMQCSRHAAREHEHCCPWQ